MIRNGPVSSAAGHHSPSLPSAISPVRTRTRLAVRNADPYAREHLPHRAAAASGKPRKATLPDFRAAGEQSIRSSMIKLFIKNIHDYNFIAIFVGELGNIFTLEAPAIGYRPDFNG